jgi:hypothetical protein
MCSFGFAKLVTLLLGEEAEERQQDARIYAEEMPI